MALDYRGIPEPENTADRDHFIDKAISGYLDARTQDSGQMRYIGAHAYVGAELSQAGRRVLSDEEGRAVEAAVDDKLRRRFGGA
jgi:hypothetical protein